MIKMKLTNKQKGHILLIPAYLSVLSVVLVLAYRFVLLLISIPVIEIVSIMFITSYYTLF